MRRLEIGRVLQSGFVAALGSVLENHFLSCGSEQPLTLTCFPGTESIHEFCLCFAAVSSEQFC